MRSLVLIVSLLTGALGCHRASSAPPAAFDVTTATTVTTVTTVTAVTGVTARRDELLEASRALATRMASGEFVTPLSEAFAPLGVYVNPGPLSARGPAAARAWLERDTLNGRSTARWTALRHDVSADGRDGYTYGYFDVIRPLGDTLPGKYHAYWRRNTAGRWQILAFSRSRRAPGPVADALPSWIAAPVVRVSVNGRDSVALLREVMHTERAFSDSVGTNLQAAFMSFAAPDAAKMEGGSQYAFGREAIGALFAGPAPPGGGPLWTPEVGTVASSGDLGFTTGPVVRRKPVEGGTPTGPAAGKYFTIWRRMPGGEWRYVVD